jgi:hypothetical protein
MCASVWRVLTIPEPRRRPQAGFTALGIDRLSDRRDHRHPADRFPQSSVFAVPLSARQRRPFPPVLGALRGSRSHLSCSRRGTSASSAHPPRAGPLSLAPFIVTKLPQSFTLASSSSLHFLAIFRGRGAAASPCPPLSWRLKLDQQPDRNGAARARLRHPRLVLPLRRHQRSAATIFSSLRHRSPRRRDPQQRPPQPASSSRVSGGMMRACWWRARVGFSWDR